MQAPTTRTGIILEVLAAERLVNTPLWHWCHRRQLTETLRGIADILDEREIISDSACGHGRGEQRRTDAQGLILASRARKVGGRDAGVAVLCDKISAGLLHPAEGGFANSRIVRARRS